MNFSTTGCPAILGKGTDQKIRMAYSQQKWKEVDSELLLFQEHQTPQKPILRATSDRGRTCTSLEDTGF